MFLVTACRASGTVSRNLQTPGGTILVAERLCRRGYKHVQISWGQRTFDPDEFRAQWVLTQDGLRPRDAITI